MTDITYLHWADIVILCGYFVFVLGIGLASSLKGRGDGVKGYFLAGRGMNWFLVGASLFGTNIGSEHFVGLAGSGAASGIAVSGFELSAMFVTVILGWVFLPVYIASGVYTMPDYLNKRFGGKRIRIYTAIIALLLSIFTKIAADLFAGSILIKQILDWNLYAAVGLQLIVVCISTVAGGLRAVMWTDTVQVIIMLVGGATLMVISFYKVGGYSEVVTRYFLAVPSENYTYHNVTSCAGIPSEDSMHLFRSASSEQFPWSGMIFGLAVSAVWYCCSDQVMVQKALASKNYSHAKGGCLLFGFIKFLPLWLMVFPGMVARILYPDEIGCTDPDVCERICYSRQGCSNVAYPLLVVRLLPIGLRGLIIAVLMAAIMSSLSSIFNSSSTIFTMDIWRPLRKNPSHLELLIVGRVFVIIMVVVSVLWIPIIAAYPSSQLFNYVQSVTSYLAPPICSTFVLAVLVPRVNEYGTFWSLIVGLIVGMIRFILEISYGAPECYADDTRPLILSKVHYLHFGILLFGIVCIVNICISLLTPPIDKIHLYRLTFWSRYSIDDRVSLLEHETKDPTAGKSIDTTKSRSDGDMPHKAKKILHFICGLDAKSDPEESKIINEKISLNENHRWRTLVNLLALILLTMGVFIFTFWA